MSQNPNPPTSNSKSFNSAWLAFSMALTVYGFDFILGWNGFVFDFSYFTSNIMEVVWRIVLSIGFWLSYSLIIIFRDKTQDPITDSASFFFFMLAVWVIGIWGGFYNFASLLHIGLAFTFYFFVLKPRLGVKDARIWTIIILFIDFFGYGALKYFTQGNVIGAFFANRLIFPIYIYAILWNIMENGADDSEWATYLFWFLLVFNMFALYNWALAPVLATDLTDFVGPEQKIQALEAANTAMANYFAWQKELFTSFRKSFNAQLEYATGGYYQGQVEENQNPKNKVGVYLEDVQAADKNFFENEQVTIWGDLKARTLDFNDNDEDEIEISISCEGQDVQGLEVPGTIAPRTKNYKITRNEQRPFECRFGPHELRPGTSTVTIKAQFNFKTYGYLKTYFMDKERIRALRRENIDPLDQYKIRDKNPKAIYTAGPIRMGMGTDDPPVGLYIEDPTQTSKRTDIADPDEEDFQPDIFTHLGITILKDWNGDIKKITELRIQIPRELKLYREETEDGQSRFCRGDFALVTPAIAAQKGFLERFQRSEQEGYEMYELTEKAIEKIKYPIIGYKSWRCSIQIPNENAASVLGRTPVATYYYRADVAYDYEIEKIVPVTIKPVVQERTPLKDCTTTCPDQDGCICDTPDCFVFRGTVIAEGSTCNRYAACDNTRRNYDQGKQDLQSIIGSLSAWVTFDKRCLDRSLTSDAAGLFEEDREGFLTNPIINTCNSADADDKTQFFEITEREMVLTAKCGRELLEVIENKKQYPANGNEVHLLRNQLCHAYNETLTVWKLIQNQGAVTDGHLSSVSKIQRDKTIIDKMKFLAPELERIRGTCS